MRHGVIVELVSQAQGLSSAEFLSVFGDGSVEARNVPRPAASSDSGQPVGEPPDPARLAELQLFAEAERELAASGPIGFEFLTEFPADVAPGFFVTAEMWALAVMLDLVDPTVHDPASAGAARVERLRGVPGAVVLQPSAAFTEWIVVHEMVHVLEEGAIATGGTREIVDPAQALVEGSAQRVALAFADTLAPDAVEDFGDFPWIFPPDGDPRLTSEMLDLIEFAYDEGARFAIALHAARGNAGLDAAYSDPPSTSEHILFPDSYLDGQESIVVEAPPMPPGAELVSSGSLGAFVLSLAVRDGDTTTPEDLDLVRGWAGDRYSIYDTEDERCLGARIVMDSAPAAAALGSALELDGRDVDLNGVGLTLTVCRPVG